VLGITLTSKKEAAVRITSKGQVTIPQAVREQAGLLPGTEVEFVVEGQRVRIVKAHATRRASRGARAVGHLRRGARHVSMSTDQIMALTRGDS
jgi:AbrB family looped-hinge helix DNA binding protein